jgi:hypothetical protein
MRTGSKHFHLTLTSNVNYFEAGLELTVLWIFGKVENIGRLSIRGSNNACYFGVGLFLDYPFCDFWNTLNLQDLDFLRSGQIEQKTDMRETNGGFSKKNTSLFVDIASIAFLFVVGLLLCPEIWLRLR